MKLKNIFAAFAAVLAIATGCTKEEMAKLSEIQVNSSFVAIDADGGNYTIEGTANSNWELTDIPEWLTAAPTSGVAGGFSIKFTAEQATETREAMLSLKCAGQTQQIKALQMTAKVDLPITPIKTVLSAPDGGTFRVKGVASKVARGKADQYGNWYINDDEGNALKIYGTLDKGGNVKGYPTDDWDFNDGDELIVEGPHQIYSGEHELVNVSVIQINKSLIKFDYCDPEGDIAKEGAEVTYKLTCKGDGVSVVIPESAKSWISVSSVKTYTDSVKVTLNYAANAGGDRAAKLTFTTTKAGKEYSAFTDVKQKGAILAVSIAEYLAAAEDATQYRISGIITKVASDSDKYGGNLYVKDATGEVYIYGTLDQTGAAKSLASFGVKEGDIIELVGTRSSFKGDPQMAKGVYQWHKTVTAKTVAEANAMEDDDKTDPKNYILLKGTVTTASGSNKTDLENYGNFDLVDESGAIYVYGVSTGWNGETKKFASLNVKLGDVITIIAYKTSYKGANQVVGMYVSHEEGGVTPPEPEYGQYDIAVNYTLGANGYDDCTATINGEAVSKVLKIGTSKAAGEFTVEVPAGCTKISFYAVAWKDAAGATVQILDGETEVANQPVEVNAGATGNAPFTITCADSDKYTVAVTGGKSYKFTSAKRVIFFGMKAE